MTRGIAPLILGFQAFDRDIRIGGVILNRLGGSRHEAKLRAVIEHYTDVPVLGRRGRGRAPGHDGAPPRARDLRRGRRRDQDRVQAIGRIVGAQVDLDRVRALAASAAPGFDAAAKPPARRRRPRPAHRHRARPRLRLLLRRRSGGAGGRRRRTGAVRHPARPAPAGHRRPVHRRRLSRDLHGRARGQCGPARGLARGHRGRPAGLRGMRRADVPVPQHHLARAARRAWSARFRATP